MQIRTSTMPGSTPQGTAAAAGRRGTCDAHEVRRW